MRLAEVGTALGERAVPLAGPEVDGHGVSVVVLRPPRASSSTRAHAPRARCPRGVGERRVEDVTALLAVDGEARRRGVRLVVGAGFAPGLSCLLARHGAATFDPIDELHVAKYGTGGPACACQHHHALNDNAMDWRDGVWLSAAAGRAASSAGSLNRWRPGLLPRALADGLLLVPAFPGIQRVTARLAATRRDRLTARLPMLRPPHPEGVLGAVRVEIRGRRGAASDVLVLGAMDRPGVAAGAVAAVAAIRFVR